MLTRKHLSGFVLLEAMISVLIIAFGLLGMAGLLTRALDANGSSLMRTKATYLAYQITDRMRANETAVNSGAYNSLSGAASDPGCSTSGCTATQLAQYDFYAWKRDVATLPSGDGAICIDSTPDDGTASTPACDGSGSMFVVKIWWTDDKTGSTQRFVTTFTP